MKSLNRSMSLVSASCHRLEFSRPKIIKSIFFDNVSQTLKMRTDME